MEKDKKLKDELLVEDSPQTTVTTQYLVQVKREVMVGTASQTVEAWIELGFYEVPSGQRRKAIEMAMAEHKLEEGSFHTIPASSAGVETPRVKKTISWE